MLVQAGLFVLNGFIEILCALHFVKIAESGFNEKAVTWIFFSVFCQQLIIGKKINSAAENMEIEKSSLPHFFLD
jgi:hypothetical protein